MKLWLASKEKQSLCAGLSPSSTDLWWFMVQYGSVLSWQIVTDSQIHLYTFRHNSCTCSQYLRDMFEWFLVHSCFDVCLIFQSSSPTMEDLHVYHIWSAGWQSTLQYVMGSVISSIVSTRTFSTLHRTTSECTCRFGAKLCQHLYNKTGSMAWKHLQQSSRTGDAKSGSPKSADWKKSGSEYRKHCMESSDTEVHERVASHAGCASRIGFSEPRWRADELVFVNARKLKSAVTKRWWSASAPLSISNQSISIAIQRLSAQLVTFHVWCLKLDLLLHDSGRKCSTESCLLAHVSPC